MIPSKIKYHDKYIPVHQIYNENYFLTPIQFRSESVLVLLVEYVPAEGPRMDALVAPIICPRLGGWKPRTKMSIRGPEEQYRHFLIIARASSAMGTRISQNTE